MEQLPSEIYEKHWLHSHEEDKDDVLVYHPSTFNFPRSRGRRGFEIKKSGEFIRHGIAPDDRPNKSYGQWVIEEPNVIRVEFPDKDKDTKQYKIKLLSHDNNTLKIKQLG
jgi:hypothetical protein